MMRFHDEEDGAGEAAPGLPAPLPADERVRWSGSPKPIAFAARVFRFRWIAAWVGVVTLGRIAAGAANGASPADLAGTALFAIGAGAVALTLLLVIGAAMAKATIITVTDKRVVLRYGVAIRKYVNIPYATLQNIDLKRYADGSGDLAIALEGRSGAGYLRLWPHARPFRFAKPEIALRSIQDVDAVAALIVEDVAALRPGEMKVSRAEPNLKIDADQAHDAVGVISPTHA